ncbi:MAG TPA: SDR family oxidoreductase [Steroidobacteraceae bacterium]|jgi:3-oxoacyl-[acyl-carrier protein] reductase|nr:SDR family oxidoreductase [Steroidobacteraceae bacterium]
MNTPPQLPAYPPARNLLAGKNVLVTAAAGTGIGFATAKRCLEEGARVFVSDLHERRLAEAVERLRAVDADRVEAKLCDVTREADVRALVGAAMDTLGQVDVLVNNAGLGGSAAVIEMTDEQWYKVLDVSLTSVFRMTRAMLPHMYAKRAGAIVNNASVLGWRAQALQAHYAAAKAGVMAFTRCAAIEAAEYGVRINAVAPSIAMHAFLNRVTSDELLTELKRREAFGRTAEVWEVANVIVFLASDLASYMTGEVVSVSSQHA